MPLLLLPPELLGTSCKNPFSSDCADIYYNMARPYSFYNDLHKLCLYQPRYLNETSIKGHCWFVVGLSGGMRLQHSDCWLEGCELIFSGQFLVVVLQ